MTINNESELVRQIDDLQSRLAYQEDLLQSLNDTIAAQDKELLILKKQCQEWASRCQLLFDEWENRQAQGSEKPPHY